MQQRTAVYCSMQWSVLKNKWKKYMWIFFPLRILKSLPGTSIAGYRLLVLAYSIKFCLVATDARWLTLFVPWHIPYVLLNICIALHTHTLPCWFHWVCVEWIWCFNSVVCFIDSFDVTFLSWLLSYALVAT